jgi:copper transport protein
VRLTLRVLWASLPVLAAVAVPGVARAHAVLETSVPASGQALAVSPPELLLDFDEEVSVDLGGVSLRLSDGTVVQIGEPSERSGAPDVVVAALPPLSDGQYIAEFHVVSADGHPVSGNVVFRIGEGAVDATVTGHGGLRAVGLAYGLARWLVYPAVVLALGPWMFALLVWPPVWRRWHRLAAGGACVAAVGALVQFVLAAPYLSGGSFGAAFSTEHWSHLAGTNLGRWLLFRVLVALGLAAVMWRRPAPGAPRDEGHAAAVLVLGTALAVSVVGDGHAGAHGWLSVSFLGGVAHVLLMAGWLGGLCVVLQVVRGGDRWSMEATARRWSPTAMAYVAGIVATGVAQAWMLLPDWNVLDTSYGRLLAAKTALVMGMVALAGVGRAVLSRSPAAAGRLGRTVLVELAVAVAVLAVTAVMVQTNPAAGAGGGSGGAGTSTSLPASPGFATRTELGPWALIIELDQAAVGRRSMTVRLDDGALPLAQPLSVTARITLEAQNLGPIPVLLAESGDHLWTTTEAVEFPAAGTWRLVVQIDDASTSASFTADLPLSP